MGSFLRITSTITLLIGFLASASLAKSEFLEELGLDFLRLPEFEKKLVEQRQISEQWDKEIESARENYRIKEQVLQQVMDQELSLVDGAGRINQLSSPQKMKKALKDFSIDGKTVQEKHCRLVVFWINKKLTLHPREDAQEIRLQLERELKHAFN